MRNILNKFIGFSITIMVSVIKVMVNCDSNYHYYYDYNENNYNRDLNYNRYDNYEDRIFLENNYPVFRHKDRYYPIENPRRYKLAPHWTIRRAIEVRDFASLENNKKSKAVTNSRKALNSGKRSAKSKNKNKKSTKIVETSEIQTNTTKIIINTNDKNSRLKNKSKLKNLNKNKNKYRPNNQSKDKSKLIVYNEHNNTELDYSNKNEYQNSKNKDQNSNSKYQNRPKDKNKSHLSQSEIEEQKRMELELRENEYNTNNQNSNSDNQSSNLDNQQNYDGRYDSGTKNTDIVINEEQRETQLEIDKQDSGGGSSQGGSSGQGGESDDGGGLHNREADTYPDYSPNSASDSSQSEFVEDQPRNPEEVNKKEMETNSVKKTSGSGSGMNLFGLVREAVWIPGVRNPKVAKKKGNKKT